MSIEMNRGRLTLRNHGVALLKHSRGAGVAIRQGTAWLTIDGEWRDVVLQPGESFVIATDADVVISAIAGPVEIALTAVAPATNPGVATALARAWTRLRGTPAASSQATAGAV
ncbi:MAG: DUF2917 domain-containing protein [Gemmatimonadota bacterium]